MRYRNKSVIEHYLNKIQRIFPFKETYELILQKKLSQTKLNGGEFLN